MMQKIIIFFFICSLCSCKKEYKNKEVSLEEKTISKEVLIEEESTLEVPVSNIEEPIKKIVLKSSFASTIKKVLSNKLSLLMPDNFTLMNRSLLEMKYPVKGRRPTEVYTNTNASINLAFNHTQNKATLEQLPEIEKVLKQQFQNPSVDFEKSEIRKINGRDFIIIEFVSPAVDSKIYNLMFITSLENRLLMGTFNCTENQREEWESKAKKIVNSVNVL